MKTIIFLLVFMLSFSSGFSQEADYEDCKDYPLLNRMPGFRISNCEEKEFDVFKKFVDEKGKQKSVEGHLYHIKYVLKKDAKAPSAAQIQRNYINAVKAAGGTLVFEDGPNFYLKLEKNNRITWVYLEALRDWNYDIYIIEEEEMRQDVFVDAVSMLNNINAEGRVALYGIYFDFDKSDVKPESDPTLKEIAKLLSENPKLNLYVVGHTDNVGDYKYNMNLSEARANAVVKTLVSKYNVDKKRLTPAGVGPLAPVTTNDTEDGKAKNRRVELIKK